MSFGVLTCNTKEETTMNNEKSGKDEERKKQRERKERQEMRAFILAEDPKPQQSVKKTGQL